MFNKIVTCGNADIIVRNYHPFASTNNNDILHVYNRLHQISMCARLLDSCLALTRVLPTSRKARYSLASVRYYFFLPHFHLLYYLLTFLWRTLFVISQVPWALNYSKWYHQYHRFPSEALQAAAFLSEYTLTDVGSWVCLPKSTSSRLKAFKYGSDDPNDPLINPAHVLRGKRASDTNHHKEFMSWVVSPTGGQRVIEEFSHLMFSKAASD